MSQIQVVQALVCEPFAQGAIHRYFEGRSDIVIDQYGFRLTSLPKLPYNRDVVQSKIVKDTEQSRPEKFLISGYSVILYPWVAQGDGHLRYAVMARKVTLSDNSFAPQWSSPMFAISRDSVPMHPQYDEMLTPPAHYEGGCLYSSFSTGFDIELLASQLLSNLKL